MEIDLYSLSLAPRIYEVIYRHFESALHQAEDELLEIMKEEVMATVVGQGPGKPAWREQMRDELRVLSTIYLPEYMESELGLDETIGLSNYVRAMVIADGAGSSGSTGVPITAGPPGRSVWDDDLAGKHPSKVKSTYKLPDGFNQKGNQFVENSLKRMRPHFKRILNSAMGTLPDLSKYVVVKMR